MPDTPISIGSNRQLLLDRRLIRRATRRPPSPPPARAPQRRSAHRPSLGRRRPRLRRALQRRRPLPRLVPLHPPRRQQQNRPRLHRLRRKQRRHNLAQTRAGPHRLPRLDGQQLGHRRSRSSQLLPVPRSRSPRARALQRHRPARCHLHSDLARRLPLAQKPRTRADRRPVRLAQHRLPRPVDRPVRHVHPRHSQRRRTRPRCYPCL